MIVISDTSPILNLAVVGKLDILQRLFSTVLIPYGVYEELAIQGKGMPGSKEVQEATWIKVQSVENEALVQSLMGLLDKGEAEAIALALEVDAQYLLIDETKGKTLAKNKGIRVIGLLGVLLIGKKNGFIHSVKEVMDELIANAGFWVSAELYWEILKEAGEQ
jgi:predicted nucleic acid-binding protein